ncbi:hypothetical protein AAWM_03641 [Aspergillus awamori]|uniref:Uncharacterized protein n=1 Tax=Aspergillus awamori TaxID=105351 RepID=A0A401KND6_ASPAW|nr:hypothetical protein AAWM_03641 [Aspergillus awamori]
MQVDRPSDALSSPGGDRGGGDGRGGRGGQGGQRARCVFDHQLLKMSYAKMLINILGRIGPSVISVVDVGIMPRSAIYIMVLRSRGG